MGERTTVIGTILAVVFQNEENGYTVARIVTDDGEPVTVVGCIPCAAPGEELILTGRYTTHPQHGEQFAADEVERHMPTGETEILNYLASGVVRGVLYTAITRARELLILVGDDVSLGKMAANDRRTRRYSGLRWRLGNGGTA